MSGRRKPAGLWTTGGRVPELGRRSWLQGSAGLVAGDGTKLLDGGLPSGVRGVGLTPNMAAPSVAHDGKVWQFCPHPRPPPFGHLGLMFPGSKRLVRLSTLNLLSVRPCAECWDVVGPSHGPRPLRPPCVGSWGPVLSSGVCVCAHAPGLPDLAASPGRRSVWGKAGFEQTGFASGSAPPGPPAAHER